MRIAWRDDDFRPSVQNSNVQQNNLYVTNNSAVRKSSTSVVSRADSRGRGTLRPTNTNTATNASINRGDARARPVSGTSVTTSSRGFSPARSIASSNMGHNVDDNIKSGGLDVKSRALTANKSSKSLITRQTHVTVDRPASAGGPMVVKRHHGGVGQEKPKPRVASRLERKIYFEQKKIDAENAAMLRRMQKNGKVETHTGMYDAQAKKPVSKNALGTGPVLTTKSRADSTSPSRSASPSPVQAPIRLNPKMSTADKVDEKTLLTLYNDCKKANSDLALENSSLRTRLNKVKLFINKYESTIKQAKKRGVPDAVLGPSSASITADVEADAKSAPGSTAKQRQQQQQSKASSKPGYTSESDMDNVEIDINYDSPSAGVIVQDKRKSRRKSASSNSSSVGIPAVTTDDEAFNTENEQDPVELDPSIDISNVPFVDYDFVFTPAELDVTTNEFNVKFEDKELQDMAEEYVILQQMRRALLHRIKNAKSTMVAAAKRAKMLSTDAEMVKARLAVHLTLSVDRPVSTQGKLLKNSKRDEAKEPSGVFPDISSATAASKGIKNLLENEITLKKQIHSSEIDIRTVDTLREHGLVAGSLGQAVREQGAISQSQKQRSQHLKQEYDRFRYEKDMYIQQYSRLVNDEKAVTKLRDSINIMRQRMGSLKRKERMRALEIASEAIDIEILRRDLGKTQDVDIINSKLNTIKEDEGL
jgi:hypothetical protein